MGNKKKYAGGGNIFDLLSGAAGLINPALGTGVGMFADLIGDTTPAKEQFTPLQQQPFKGKVDQFLRGGGQVKAYNFPSHEMGGGKIDKNGTISNNRGVAELEKQETFFKGFVFSDVLGEDGMTFADKSKKIAKKFDKPDEINQATLKATLGDLSRKNEDLKMRLGGFLTSIFRNGGEIDPMDVPSLETPTTTSSFNPVEGTVDFSTTVPRSEFLGDMSSFDEVPNVMGGGEIQLRDGGPIKPLPSLEFNNQLFFDGSTTSVANPEGRHLENPIFSSTSTVPDPFSFRPKQRTPSLKGVDPQTISFDSLPIDQTPPDFSPQQVKPDAPDLTPDLTDPSKLKDLEMANLFFRGFVKPNEDVQKFDNPFEGQAISALENSPVTFTPQINEIRRQQAGAVDNLNNTSRSVNVQRAGVNQIAANSSQQISEVLQQQQLFELEKNARLSSLLDNFGRQRVRASERQDDIVARAQAAKEDIQNDFVKSVSNKNVFQNNLEVQKLQANEGLQLLNQLVPNFKTQGNYDDYLKAVSIDDKKGARQALIASGVSAKDANRILNLTFFQN